MSTQHLIKRYLQNAIQEDALSKSKMAFISGPRQCGKTTLVRSLENKLENDVRYFTWDDDEFRKLWLHNPKNIFEHASFSDKKKQIIILDEIHKQRTWKRSLKGLYDLYKEHVSFVITGSARLDIYRKGGDSLQGRYFHYHLHPFSLAESERISSPPQKDWLMHTHQSFPLESLLTLGGFPEPLLSASEKEASRWRRLRRERLIREDVRDLRSVNDLQAIENLTLLLEEIAGSTLSYESLREDLQVSFATVKDWVNVLSALYFCFLLKPYSRNIRRALHKEPKLYLYDWSAIKNTGARLENLVACHLLKACHAWTDLAFGNFKLFYIKDKEKREVDFLITHDDVPYVLIEVKSNEKEISKSLRYYTTLLKPKFSFQIVLDKNLERKDLTISPPIFVMEASRFLSALV